MVALLAASLLFCGTGPSPHGAQVDLDHKVDQALSDYFSGAYLRPADSKYISGLDIGRGGFSGVRLSLRGLSYPGEIRVRAGLMFVNADDSFQRLMAREDMIYPDGCATDGASDEEGTLSPDLISSILHGPLVQASKAPQAERRPLIHVVCIDMNKKMPENMRFKLRPCPDPMLAKVCGFDKNAIVRGVYDQPRVWIYTDNATIEDCNAHLTRRITPSIYLRALWEDSTLGALDLSKPGIRKCIDPKLIEGTNAPATAKVWLIQTLDQINPDGLTHVLETDGSAFPENLAGDDKAANMAALLDALADSKTPSVVAALPKFIDAALPADRREAVLSKCKHKF